MMTVMMGAFAGSARPVASLRCTTTSMKGCLRRCHAQSYEGFEHTTFQRVTQGRAPFQVLGEKRVWLFDWSQRKALHLRGDYESAGTQIVGLNNWERQSMAELHGTRSQAFPSARAAERWVADLKPGDLLYIPRGWFHEVHTRTPSFSLGWRFNLKESDDAEPALRKALAERKSSLGVCGAGIEPGLSSHACVRGMTGLPSTCRPRTQRRSPP